MGAVGGIVIQVIQYHHIKLTLFCLSTSLQNDSSFKMYFFIYYLCFNYTPNFILKPTGSQSFMSTKALLWYRLLQRIKYRSVATYYLHNTNINFM